MPLPKERLLWSSPPRTSIQIQSLNKFPGKEPFQLSSNSGYIHLTNQRIIYLPESPTSTFQSFAAPLLKLHDSRVTTPFFGPNAWQALAQTVNGGGIPSQHPAVEVKLTFKDGGAYDFHTKFVEIKERLRQAADVAAESGQAIQGSHSDCANLENVYLEQLPAYEESAGGNRVQDTAVETRSENRPRLHLPSQGQQHAHPDEPPPGYDAT